MAEAIPRRWLQGEDRSRMRLIPWEADAKGHYDEAIRPNRRQDFEDNRVPGGDQKFGSLTIKPELDNQRLILLTHMTGINLAFG